MACLVGPGQGDRLNCERRHPDAQRRRTRLTPARWRRPYPGALLIKLIGRAQPAGMEGIACFSPALEPILRTSDA